LEGSLFALIVIIAQFALYACWLAIFYGSTELYDELVSFNFKFFIVALGFAFLIVSPLDQFAKFRLSKNFVLKQVSKLETRTSYVILTFAVTLGLATSSASISVLLAATFSIAFAQLFVQIPINILTGTGIALSLASQFMQKKDPKFLKTVIGPYFVSGLQLFLTYLLLSASWKYYWIYYACSYSIMILYGIFLRRKYSALPQSFLIFDAKYFQLSEEEA
jgi:hypothetical protein